MYISYIEKHVCRVFVLVNNVKCSIQVADFDFGGTSSSLDLDDPIQAAMFDERTFWTHLRDELAESSILFRWLSRRPKFLTTLSLMDDEILDDEDVSNKTVDPTLPPATSSSNNNNSTSGYSSIDNADAKWDVATPAAVLKP